ncbi:purine operon repressor PurR [Tumebacillus sp. BK434]|uniref:pur operon repressor n=1 Tax=Tumebacillus sp. BK434 TaxID=2512169 RepID=UPI0010507928|nr:pur operon repressor [Tumebacillus sp. BK434]TCP52705.1 purine operon repressor PurR [Tumebacillus sp. BK434]
MSKMRRSERIVRLTQILLEQPHRVLSLTEMADKLSSAKSSLSEDLAIIREVMESEGLGTLETQAGAAGGVRYVPGFRTDLGLEYVQKIGTLLGTGDRILPGGFLYMSDVLGDPMLLDTAGKMFAARFKDAGADYVVTVETKGIPLAVATARYLGVPMVVVRRDHKVTEGSSVSINYVSGSRRIQTMSLSRRSLPEKSKVLVVDDFMKAGGTVKALVDLMKEFQVEVVGTGIFMSTEEPQDKMISGYVSLATLREFDEQASQVEIVPGTYFSQEEL